MITYYEDWFKCQCGEQYIIKVPVKWASENMDRFQDLLEKQEEAQKAHFLCQWLYEIKTFLKTPVVIQVGR